MTAEDQRALESIDTSLKKLVKIGEQNQTELDLLRGILKQFVREALSLVKPQPVAPKKRGSKNGLR